jgi:hypothetical protein
VVFVNSSKASLLSQRALITSSLTPTKDFSKVSKVANRPELALYAA